MAFTRRSFGGRPPRNTNHPQHVRADGPAFSQQAGFFPSHPTNGSGPPNNGVSGNSWHNQNNRNRNFISEGVHATSGGNFQGQRRGQFPRPSNNNENLRPGKNNHNGRAPYESQSRISRPNRNYGQGHLQNHNIRTGPAYQHPGQAYRQRPPYQRQGHNQIHGLQTILEGNQHNPNQRWRGAPNRRNRQNDLQTIRTPSIEGFNQYAQCDATITQGFPQTDIDVDGDIEMTDAPPLEFDLIQLLKDGTLAMHFIAEIMRDKACI